MLKRSRSVVLALDALEIVQAPMLFGGLADSCGKPGLGFARSIAAMRRHASRHRVCANHFSVRATGIPEALCRQVAAIALRRTPPQQGCDHAEVAQRIEPERPPIMTPVPTEKSIREDIGEGERIV